MIVLLHWAKFCTLIDWLRPNNPTTWAWAKCEETNFLCKQICIQCFRTFRLAHFRDHHMRSDRQNNKCLNMMHFVFLFLCGDDAQHALLPLCDSARFHFFCIYSFWSARASADSKFFFIIVYRRRTLQVSDSLLAVVSPLLLHFLCYECVCLQCILIPHNAFFKRRKFLLFISRVMVSTVLRTSTIRSLLATTKIMT